MSEPAIAASVVDRNNPFLARIVERKLLTTEGQTTPEDPPKAVFQITIDITGSGIHYKCGDSLGVYPSNKPETVDALLAALKLDPDAPVTLPGGAAGAQVPLREALERRLSLRNISKNLLLLARDNARDAGEKARLAQIVETPAPEELKSWLEAREVPDLLEEFPSVRIPAQELAAQLRRLTPRLYSISSHPHANDDGTEHVELTVDVVRYRTNGHLREGVCSNHLAYHAPENSPSLPIFVSASHFAPPKDPLAPLIMVGPGVGVAPFHGFLQQRDALRKKGEKVGPCWLFFGDRHEATHFLYKDKLLGWERDGLLTHLSLAWSRDQETKVYVQDRMRENGAEIWTWLSAKNAYFHVCGDARNMARDVDAALHEIVAKHGNMSAEAAKDYIGNLRRPASDDKAGAHPEARYQRDVY
ncbi:MAG: hypothetical protein LBG65_06225 [Puniceicoccales bacterium]|jgi:sulfite reductase (NADPH) flavoprotein alpha-component|nr:hypothetical protein [Puniceicoccales bacterium]